MTNNKLNLNYIEKLNTPKTETRLVVETEDLYPDLGYEDVSTDKGYGPCYNSNYCNCHLQRRIDISIKTNGWFYTDSPDTRELMEGVQNVWMGGHATLSGSREFKAKTLRIRSVNDYHTILNDWNRQGVKSLQIVGEFWRNSNPKGVHSTFVNRLSEIGRILNNPSESAERSLVLITN